MSTTTNKRTHAAALADAEAFRALFPPASYTRWEVAGSVRRGAPLVGDVEHVVIPAFGDVTDGGDLFAVPRRANLLLERLDELARCQAVTKHVYGGANVATGGYTPTSFRWGEKYRGVDYRGACHEVFCADADNWGATLAIRTGPGSFSKMLVTNLQRHGHINEGGYVRDKGDVACAGCGWRGAFAGDRGLLFVAPEDWDAVIGSGGKYVKPRFVNGNDHAGVCPQCRRQDGLSMARVSVPDERRYFELCGVRWCEPSERREQSAHVGGMR